MKTIAVFDFDGTLTRRDTLLEFIKYSKGRLPFYLGFLRFSPLLVAMKLKMYPNWKVKQQLFSHFYKGTSIEEFDRWCENFKVNIDKIARPKALRALKSHQAEGNKVVVVSASIENWVKPWASKVHIDTILATKIEIDKQGLLTGRFLTKNCYGQEKVDRLLDAVPNLSEYTVFAYGNSRGDKELLELADKSFYNKFE
jgi:phosphatidylglycerophosphatase C